MDHPAPPGTAPPGTRPGWRRLSFAGLDLEVPEDLVATDEQAIDGEVLVVEGGGLRLTLDASLFRDRLSADPSRAGSRRLTEPAGGGRHAVVAVDVDDGTVLAADLSVPVTATVHVRTGADVESALHIIRTITHTEETPDD